MSKHRPGQINREAAERLLRGESGVPQDGPDALAGLLAAAAAPAQAGELAGESAAMAAFWEASRSVGPQRHEQSGLRTKVAKFLTVKAAAAAVALTAFGGAALAAGSGALPAALTEPHRGAHPSPTHHLSSPAARPTPSISPHPVGSPEPASAPTAAPAMAGLCQKYLERLKKTGFHDANGKGHRIADDPIYAALVKAAGGEPKIIAHCQTLLRTQRGGGQQGHWPTLPPGFPTKMPTWPSSYPPWPSEPSTGQGNH
ncbi:MAG: hypothetical protein JWN52_983 [Actinomycetia bacterium]|nr:hypothetical protein [Actinomycetes bacterium]